LFTKRQRLAKYLKFRKMFQNGKKISGLTYEHNLPENRHSHQEMSPPGANVIKLYFFVADAPLK